MRRMSCPLLPSSYRSLAFPDKANAAVSDPTYSVCEVSGLIAYKFIDFNLTFS